jgi:hypothetical protein
MPLYDPGRRSNPWQYEREDQPNSLPVYLDNPPSPEEEWSSTSETEDRPPVLLGQSRGTIYLVTAERREFPLENRQRSLVGLLKSQVKDICPLLKPRELADYIDDLMQELRDKLL